MISWGSIDTTTLPAAMLPAAKDHLRIDFSDDDGDITRKLGQAMSLLEKYWGWQIFGTSVDWSPDPATQAPGPCMECPVRPVASFTAKDDAGLDVTADYELKRTGPSPAAEVFLCRKDETDFPADLDVVLVVGFSDTAGMDPAVEAGILRVAGTLYEHRESVSTLAPDQMPFWLSDLLGDLWIPRA